MLAEQFTAAAAAAARNTHAVDQLARLTWRANAEGQLQDAEAEAVGAALRACRRSFGQGARGLPPTRAAVASLGPPGATRDRRIDRRASSAGAEQP